MVFFWRDFRLTNGVFLAILLPINSIDAEAKSTPFVVPKSKDIRSLIVNVSLFSGKFKEENLSRADIHHPRQETQDVVVYRVAGKAKHTTFYP